MVLTSIFLRASVGEDLRQEILRPVGLGVGEELVGGVLLDDLAIEQTTTTRITLNDPDGVTTITGRALVFTRMDEGGYEVAAIVPVNGVEFGGTGCLEWSEAQ